MGKFKEIPAPPESRSAQNITVLSPPELVWRGIGECRESNPEEYTKALVAVSNLAAISRLLGIVYIGPNAVNTPMYGIEPYEEFHVPAFRSTLRREAFLQSFQTTNIRYDLYLFRLLDRQTILLDRFVRQIYKIGNIPYKYSLQSFLDQINSRNKQRNGGPYVRGNELAVRNLLKDMIVSSEVLLLKHYGFPPGEKVSIPGDKDPVEYDMLRLQINSYLSTLLAGHKLDRILKTLRSSPSLEDTLADEELLHFFGAGVFLDESVKNTIGTFYHFIHQEARTA